jgi:hypothetical protein
MADVGPEMNMARSRRTARQRHSLPYAYPAVTIYALRSLDVSLAGRADTSHDHGYEAGEWDERTLESDPQPRDSVRGGDHTLIASRLLNLPDEIQFLLPAAASLLVLYGAPQHGPSSMRLGGGPGDMVVACLQMLP